MKPPHLTPTGKPPNKTSVPRFNTLIYPHSTDGWVTSNAITGAHKKLKAPSRCKKWPVHVNTIITLTRYQSSWENVCTRNLVPGKLSALPCQQDGSPGSRGLRPPTLYCRPQSNRLLGTMFGRVVIGFCLESGGFEREIKNVSSIFQLW